MAGQVMDLLQEINRGGTTIVMVTHDPALAARTIRMLDGNADGDADGNADGDADGNADGEEEQPLRTGT